eukprot:1286209-Pyramimonas_sp.AAC.3
MSIVMQSLSRVQERMMQQFTAVLSPWKSMPLVVPLPPPRKVHGSSTFSHYMRHNTPRPFRTRTTTPVTL